MNQNKLSNIFLLKKPVKWTSFDVVKKIRFAIKKKYNLKKIKVGHCGTLDPLATGLLIIFTGDKTKSIKNFEGLEKTYIGTLKMGCVTDSFDAETPEKNHQEYNDVTLEKIKKVFIEFEGLQKQIPPIFSAVKVDGERLYKKARRGEKVTQLNYRSIIIHQLEILDIDIPYIKFKVTCSKGTYIRTLAHDIGKRLNCGAYLVQLNRVAIGDYSLQDAYDIKDLESFI